MSCVNPNDSLFKILLKELKNPLLAEIEFDNQEDYKPGVSELFDSIPELESIGNEEQYSQYLDTIFPDSQVKDIVYHGTPSKIEKFSKDYIGTTTSFGDSKDVETGFFFSSNPIAAQSYTFGATFGDPLAEIATSEEHYKKLSEKYKKGKFSFPVILDVKNPKIIDENKSKKMNRISIPSTSDSLIYKNVQDSIALFNTDIFEDVYVVPEPEQIHILGTKQDIEGFKKFVGKTAIKEPVEVDEEINSYISNELFKKFGVMVPTVDNENLIDDGAVAAFNNTVAMNNGILPAQYYNGVNNTHKWILNKKQLYDLVDKDTSEVYLKDVNLTTGVHEEKLTYSPINEEERDATINSLNDAVKDYRIDEILAEKGYDVNDIISNLEAATTQEELDKIINKLLRMIC